MVSPVKPPAPQKNIQKPQPQPQFFGKQSTQCQPIERPDGKKKEIGKDHLKKINAIPQFVLKHIERSKARKLTQQQAWKNSHANSFSSASAVVPLAKTQNNPIPGKVSEKNEQTKQKLVSTSAAVHNVSPAAVPGNGQKVMKERNPNTVKRNERRKRAKARKAAEALAASSVQN